MNTSKDLFSIKEASEWASEYLSKEVTTANISYLINYGKINKLEDNGSILVSKVELINYYDSFHGKREVDWKGKLGEDLNWTLSFDNLKESETTKHVHRLHPYKGKFIPQLVEYFLDLHTDNFKTEYFFKKDDVILDPFCGSGTTLVQANELGIHGIGIDISAFNTLISNSKICEYNLEILKTEIKRITTSLDSYIANTNIVEFESNLLNALSDFNKQYFPVPDFKRQVQLKLIDGDLYGQKHAMIFLPIYKKLVDKYNIRLRQPSSDTFLEKWYSQQIRDEIEYAYSEINKCESSDIRNVLYIILSRTMRSCRATTHSDLATLKEPVTTTYYCTKHGKICKPIFSILKWWKTYSKDTLKRIAEFAEYKTNTLQCCITGDSRTIDIFDKLKTQNPLLYNVVREQKIKGIFSSPPYVGLIDYHEQHAYSYDLFGFERNDDAEIGPLFQGQGKLAQKSYIEGISKVLINSKQYLIDNYDIFLVANDKYDLYPKIAENAGMKIVNRYKRPVLNRTERDKGAYSEIIFHLKNK